MERSGVLDGWLGRLPGGRTLLDSPFWRRVLSGAALLLVGTMAGRLTGFVREATLAYRLGVSDATDVAIVSFTYSDLMTNLLIAGSMSAVLIPEFARLRAVHEVEASGSSRDADVVLYWRVLVWVTGAAIAVALCASLGSGAVVRRCCATTFRARCPRAVRGRGRSVRHAPVAARSRARSPRRR